MKLGHLQRELQKTQKLLHRQAQSIKDCCGSMNKVNRSRNRICTVCKITLESLIKKLAVILLVVVLSGCYAQDAYSDVTASFYGLEACEFNKHPKCLTASGRSLYELERKRIPYCASWEYPIGTQLELTNKRGVKARCTVLDRGPAKRLIQKLDLSRRVFTRLGKEELGIIEVQVRRIK